MNATITTTSIPDGRKNWVISVEIQAPVHVKIRLVPDKLIADHDSLKNYIIKTLNQSWQTPEEMILNIIEGLNNELVPKWVEVFYSQNGVSVRLEDQHPGLDGFTPPT